MIHIYAVKRLSMKYAQALQIGLRMLEIDDPLPCNLFS
jgi:hypothetical protein